MEMMLSICQCNFLHIIVRCIKLTPDMFLPHPKRICIHAYEDVLSLPFEVFHPGEGFKALASNVALDSRRDSGSREAREPCMIMGQVKPRADSGTRHGVIIS